MNRRAIDTVAVGRGMGLLLVLGLAACGTPADYRHPGEVPEGPGILTGEEGAARFPGDEPADGAHQEAGRDGAGQTPAAGNDTGPMSRCDCVERGELEAYRDFLRWKARAVGTPEYEEFQDWRAWRRERRAAD